MNLSSHNEWDKLNEIIVGDGFPLEIPFDDTIFKMFFHDNIHGNIKAHNAGRWSASKKIIEEHAEDLNEFVNLLIDNGIKVLRPKSPGCLKITKTLCWQSTNFPALNVRDLTLIIGDKIIETPVLSRWRQFENDYLKHIFLDYFKCGAAWISAPRPLVTDNSFDLSRFHNTESYERLKSKSSNYLDCGVEIMFDAANCMRLGNTILMNASSEHERLGVKWLQQTLGEKYRVWEVNITDNHIDSTFLPLRPGLALITMDIIEKLPKPLQKWDYIFVPPELPPVIVDNYIPLASERIFCNILSIAPDKIICMPEYYSILKSQLNKYNIEVIPNRIRYSKLFGGGHHCLTLDTNRQGALEDYF